MRDGKPCLGVTAILAQSPKDNPTSPKRSARPLCHATLQTLRDEYKHIYRNFVAAYREAAAAVAAGCRDTLFPMHAYPPP